ncbi:MAG: 4Fe-4S dicluster domain-containing protein, partial [Candidatus Latescibacteria bacterium]|nr:4Fe-4S dicluster domain-containing protein [Candidatus Latescibacterota bacterium]
MRIIDQAISQTREYEKLLDCVHCGLCLSACPTYNEIGVEMDSPRGRIYLIRSFVDGKIPLSEDFTDHLSLCLGCRACETACPSGVHFGEILEWSRSIVEERLERSPLARLIRSLTFNRLLPSPRLLRLAALGLRLYQISGLSTVLHSTRLLPPPLSRLDDLSPRIPPWSMRRPLDKVTPAVGSHHHRVGFLSGCIMSVAFGHINRATLHLLSRNRCEVVTPRGQTCCGALHLHNGERAQAIELAKATIDAFECTGAEAVITNSAGCGSTMKEYADLLHNDPEYADRAAVFSRKVKDIAEYLIEIGFEK